MTQIKYLAATPERSFVMDDEGIWAWGNIKYSSRVPEGADPASWCASTSAQVGHHRYAQDVPVRLHTDVEGWQGITDSGGNLLLWNAQSLYITPAEIEEGKAAVLQAIDTHGLAFEYFWSGAKTLYGRTANGQLYGWGVSHSGPAKTAAPQLMEAIDKAKETAVGVGHVLVIDSLGNLWAWGANAAGQLGLGHLNASALPQRVPLDVAFVAVAAGSTHSLALDIDGQLWGWGSNHMGQISDQIPKAFIARPQKIPLKQKAAIRSLHAGLHVSAAVTQQGKIWTWGFNSLGQLGLPHHERSAGVHVLESVPAIASLSLGQSHMLALDREGGCWAWGDNRHGACQAQKPGTRIQLQPHQVQLVRSVPAEEEAKEVAA